MMDNRLKDCREELEMTQTELGYVFGVKKATISNWENSYDIIPLKKLVKFCNLYNYSIDYVCGLTKPNNPVKIEKLNKVKVGNRLKEIRIKLDLTQQQMADICSISREAYCHYELGINLVSTITLYTICKNYKISMIEFLK